MKTKVTRTTRIPTCIISIILKEENKAFKVEKYEHTYPHCWRTDKPVLYYPLDSWFIKTTAMKDRMVELNKTINWKPESTGIGPLWQLAGEPGGLEPCRVRATGAHRCRYGAPKTVDEEICIGSLEKLK